MKEAMKGREIACFYNRNRKQNHVLEKIRNNSDQKYSFDLCSSKVEEKNI